MNKYPCWFTPIILFSIASLIRLSAVLVVFPIKAIIFWIRVFLSIHDVPNMAFLINSRSSSNFFVVLGALHNSGIPLTILKEKSSIGGFREKAAETVAMPLSLTTSKTDSDLLINSLPQCPRAFRSFLFWWITLRIPQFNSKEIFINRLTISEDSSIELNGPLGVDDFPTKLKVTVKLKHARPRDTQDISSMFTCGQGDLLIPLNGKKFESFFDKDNKKQMSDLGFTDEYMVNPAGEGLDDIINNVWPNLQ